MVQGWRPHLGYGGGSTHDPMWDRWLFAGLIAGAAAVAVVLATGHLSALVFDGSWPRYRNVEIPEVLLGVLERPGDPGRAWDPFNRGGAPPGPTAWWGTLATLVTVIAAPGRLAYHWGRRRHQPSTGRWAEARDLRELRVRAGRDGRLVLGTARRRAIAVEARHSLLVFGPTQSGKTTATAIPAILGWPGPVMATTVKDDLITDTIGWRSSLGDVAVYDPADISSYWGSGWSPLAGITNGASAARAAWELSMATKSAVGSGVNLAQLWFSSASKCLAPYLLAAAVSGRGMDDVARWIDAEDRDEVITLLAPTHPDAVLAHQATFRRDDKARSSLFQCMQLMTTAYLDPTVAASATSNDIVADRLLDGGAHTLYVSSPPKDQDRLRPLFATLVGQVIGAVYHHAATTRAPLSAPLLLVLDEAANIAPVDDLATIASTAASMGLQMVTVFQDLAQLRLRYGEAAGTVVNNHRAKLLLPGVSDVGTLELFSRLAGEEEVDRASVTVDGSGRRSATTAGQFRRLLPVETARQLPKGRGILVYGALPPVRLRLRPWYRVRRFRRRAGIPNDAHLAPPSPAVAPASPSPPGSRWPAPAALDQRRGLPAVATSTDTVDAPGPAEPSSTGVSPPDAAPVEGTSGTALRPRRSVRPAEKGLDPVVTVLDAVRARRADRRRATPHDPR